MSKNESKRNALSATFTVWFFVFVLVLPLTVKAQEKNRQSAASTEDKNARPPVTEADLGILRRAREIFDSPFQMESRPTTASARWGAKTFSLCCALATSEIGRKLEHRGAVLQEGRFVIDEIFEVEPQRYARVFARRQDVQSLLRSGASRHGSKRRLFLHHIRAFVALLRMRNNGKNYVSIAVYLEVEAVRAVDAPLPNVTALIVLLGSD